MVHLKSPCIWFSTPTFRAIIATLFLLHSVGINLVLAQDITSSGLGTDPKTMGDTTTITGGERPGNGTNLFHSFGKFNIDQGHTANFLNAVLNGDGAVIPGSNLPTNNILGRVTGGNASEIFGTIKTTGFGNANLFLMNPKGIVFGPNASLDISGAFYATTADYILLGLGENERFSASLTNTDKLISGNPLAFGFLGSGPPALDTVTDSGDPITAGITVKELTSLTQSPISLISRDANVSNELKPGIEVREGRLQNVGGIVNLVSVGSPIASSAGEVPVDPSNFRSTLR